MFVVVVPVLEERTEMRDGGRRYEAEAGQGNRSFLSPHGPHGAVRTLSLGLVLLSCFATVLCCVVLYELVGHAPPPL